MKVKVKVKAKLTLEIEAEAPAAFAEGDIGVVRDNPREREFKAESTAFGYWRVHRLPLKVSRTHSWALCCC